MVNFPVMLDPMGSPYAYNPKSPVMNPNGMDFFSIGLNVISGYPTTASLLTATSTKAETNSVDDIGNWPKK